jgi:hypothetical protein
MTAQRARFRSSRQRSGPSFAEALKALRAGGVLRLTYVGGSQAWDLNDRPVSLETVVLLTSCREIVPDDDSLFANAAPQSWRIRP